MSKKPTCQGGFCLLNPLDLPIVCQSCPRYDRALLRLFKNESSILDDLPPEPKECPICGTMFIDRANKEYCSTQCCKRAYRLRKLARTTEDKLKAYEWRVCVICGNDYYPHTDRQKTCGGKCSEEYMRRVYKREPTPKRLARLKQNYQESEMVDTIICNPVFTLQFKRHEQVEQLPRRELESVSHYLSANISWWKSLSLPRQAVILGLAYSVGTASFLHSFRNFLFQVQQCKWAEAKSSLLMNQWTRTHTTRAVELARQIEQGIWQRDPLEQLAEEEEDEKLEQGSLV